MTPLPAAGSLWWPGQHRAGALMSETAFLAALVRVEQAWLAALVSAGVAPEEAAADLGAVVRPEDAEGLAVAAEAGGNPVIPLVALLRERVTGPASAWLHRGLTSQDVVDSALMLCAADAAAAVRSEVAAQVALLAGLAERHRASEMVARTLTQHAVPTTFGAKVATWLHGVLDARDALAALTFPAQLGGAAGTLAGVVELAGAVRARSLRDAFPAALGLAPAAPWHTHRSAVTGCGDAAVLATDAFGRIANDVLTLGRPEVAELAEGSGGGSSTMPHKANPTLSVLVRRAALSAPQLAATLHLAAAEQVDERADGGWHAEWETLATLLRRTVVAAAQTTALLRDLRVDTARMADRVTAAGDDLLAEQRSLAAVAGKPPAPSYLGLVDDLVTEALQRASGPAPHPPRAARVPYAEEGTR